MCLGGPPRLTLTVKGCWAQAKASLLWINFIGESFYAAVSQLYTDWQRDLDIRFHISFYSPIPYFCPLNGYLHPLTRAVAETEGEGGL